MQRIKLRQDDDTSPKRMKLRRLSQTLLCLVVLVCGCTRDRAHSEQGEGGIAAERPAVSTIPGYRVLVDEAHFNIPGFEPLVELLSRAGYQVARNEQPFMPEGLKDADILLIGAPIPHDLSNSVAFSPDGRVLAYGGENRTIQLWNLETGKLEKELRDTDWVGRVSFSPDGRTLASASADQSVKLWDTRTGRVRAVLVGHAGPVRSVSFSPNGELVASSGDDQTVRLWEAGSGRLLKTLGAHTSTVHDVAFSPDGVILATSGDDRMTRLWDVESGAILTTLSGHRGPVHQVAFSRAERGFLAL